MRPEIRGIDNILKTYTEVLPEITFSGPTFFTSVLDYFNDFVKENEANRIYSICLIITDGDNHDLGEVKRMLVKAADMPCSFIIVGLGDNDDAFEQMN